MAIYRGKNRLSVTILTDKEDDLNTELTEQEEKLDLLEAEVDALPIDPPSQDKTVIPSSEQQVIIADDGFKLGSVTVEPQVTHTEKLTEQKLLLTELKSDVNALGDKPMDRLQWKCDNIKTLTSEFSGYTGESLNEVLVGLDTSNVTNMKSIFYNCVNLTTIPQLDTSNVTSMESMFEKCAALTTIPQLNTSSVTTTASMFNGCSNLTTIPQLDTSNVTNMAYMFRLCTALTTIPQLDTSNVTNMFYLVQGCANLTTIEGLDLRSVTDTGNMVSGCTNLTNLTLKNISGKTKLSIGSGTSYGTLLTLDSLLNTVKELWDLTGATRRTLTMSTASKELLANIYVKLIDVTDEMRAEDEYVDNKKPFEVCESTDEGAMLITEYLISKNWSLA